MRRTRVLIGDAAPAVPQPLAPRRHHVAVRAVFLVAGLATVGTSASPVPPPAVSAAATGTVALTRAKPMARVDVVVSANAALRSADQETVAVTINAHAASGVDDPAPATIAVIEALDGRREGAIDAEAFLTTRLGEGCGAGECSGRYRITMILSDPTAERATIAWAVDAAARFGPGTATGSAPPDATLTVTASPPVLSESLRLVAAPIDPVVVDAEHPRTVLAWDATIPPEGQELGSSPRLVLRIDGPAAPPSGRPAGTLSFAIDGRPIGGAALGLDARTFLLHPVQCREAAGCPGRLTATIDWAAGDPAGVLEPRFTLTGVSFPGPNEAVVPFAFASPTQAAFGPDSPRLVATTTGSFDVGPGRFGKRVVTVTLDASALPQGGGGIGGVIIGRLSGTATATGATTRTRVSVAIGERGVPAPPGVPSSVVSGPIDISCRDGRSRCSARVELGAWVGSDDPVDAHVEWTFTATFLSAEPAALPPEVRLEAVAEPAPS